ncbi:MAG: RluA family pseudouridine synthase, partial [Bacillales bacterium]|nr:RluA family pseudouridine synthase [Bacillales bacterium]
MKAIRKGEILEVSIPKSFSGLTIAEFLRQKWRVPKKQLHEWRMNQSVYLNGKPVSLSVVIQEKDHIQLPLFKKGPLPVPPSFRPIEVLMEDDHFIIVNKPAGITTHPNSPEDTDTLLHLVAGHLCVNGDIGFLRHVHRLDKDTTGA